MALPWRQAGRPVNTTSSFPTRICIGDGLVLRNDHLVAYISYSGEPPAELLERLESINGEPAPSSSLLRYLQALPSTTSVAVAFLQLEVDVVMVGGVRLSYRDEDRVVRQEDGGPAQLVALPESVLSLVLHSAEAPPEVNTTSNLLLGTVPGGGAEVTLRTGEPRTSSGPVEAERTPPVDDGRDRLNLLTLDDPEEIEVQPLPYREHATSGRPKEAIVEGLACNQGHINRLSASYCSSCGRRLQDTLSVRKGVRPPLGTLILDDGSTFSVDRDYVAGRAPQQDDRVTNGAAEALAIEDPDREISRIHAEIRLDKWDALLIDRHSANGTYLRRGGTGGWLRLNPLEWHRLSDGDEVALGQRVLVFQER